MNAQTNQPEVAQNTVERKGESSTDKALLNKNIVKIAGGLLIATTLLLFVFGMAGNTKSQYRSNTAKFQADYDAKEAVYKDKDAAAQLAIKERDNAKADLVRTECPLANSKLMDMQNGFKFTQEEINSFLPKAETCNGGLTQE